MKKLLIIFLCALIAGCGSNKTKQTQAVKSDYVRLKDNGEHRKSELFPQNIGKFVRGRYRDYGENGTSTKYYMYYKNSNITVNIYTSDNRYDDTEFYDYLELNKDAVLSEYPDYRIISSKNSTLINGINGKKVKFSGKGNFRKKEQKLITDLYSFETNNRLINIVSTYPEEDKDKAEKNTEWLIKNLSWEFD